MVCLYSLITVLANKQALKTHTQMKHQKWLVCSQHQQCQFHSKAPPSMGWVFSSEPLQNFGQKYCIHLMPTCKRNTQWNGSHFCSSQLQVKVPPSTLLNAIFEWWKSIYLSCHLPCGTNIPDPPSPLFIFVWRSASTCMKVQECTHNNFLRMKIILHMIGEKLPQQLITMRIPTGTMGI